MSYLVLNKQSATPSAPAAGKIMLYSDSSANPLKFIDENGNIFQELKNASTASVSAGYAADTYLAGSSIAVTANTWKAGSSYYCTFDMVKTAAGTATPIITVRMGTAGTTSDTSIVTLTFAAGTAAVDTGLFEVWINFRSIGSGTSAVIQAVGRITHHLAATGLTSTGASGTGIIIATSSGFASNTATTLGISFNGGASFAGTNTLVQSNLIL